MTTYRIRNWEKFQPYRDGRPVHWIKLHRVLLDNYEFSALPGEAAKTLILLWLVAAEKDGALPATPALAFRLRIDARKLAASMEVLAGAGFVESVEIRTESYETVRNPTALKEKEEEKEEEEEEEKEVEKETENTRKRVSVLDTFTSFWTAYPRKTAKANARISWKKLNPDADTVAVIMASVEAHKNSRQWLAEGGRYIPHAATWLNQRRWEDEIAPAPGQCGDGSPVPWKEADA